MGSGNNAPRLLNPDTRCELSASRSGYFTLGTESTGAGVAQSVQCLATDWTTGQSKFVPRQRQKIFHLASVSRPALGPTQPPVQWVPWVLSPGVKRGRGVTLTTHPHLVPRSWMSRSYTSSPSCASRGVLWDCFTFLPNQQQVTAISRAGGEEGPLALAGTRTPHPDQINL
jgi:hypothetical protein